MAATLKLYVDWFNKRLQKSATNSERFSMPPLFEGDVVPLQIQIVEPNPDGGGSDFILPAIDNMAIKVALASAPTGTAGGPTPFATNYASWTKDVINKTFTGYLALNTGAIATYIGDASSADVFMEIEITEATGVTTIYQSDPQEPIKLRAEIIESDAVDVPAGLTPLSLEVAMQLFPQFINEKGRTITFKSPSETYERIIGVNDDGSALDTTEPL